MRYSAPQNEKDPDDMRDIVGGLFSAFLQNHPRILRRKRHFLSIVLPPVKSGANRQNSRRGKDVNTGVGCDYILVTNSHFIHANFAENRDKTAYKNICSIIRGKITQILGRGFSLHLEEK